MVAAGTIAYTGAFTGLDRDMIVRGWHEQLGALRTKAGRSDLPAAKRTLSMSCSDKLARWVGVGVQGALLSQFVDQPLLLASVITSAPGSESAVTSIYTAK
jgi:tRNA-specific adenosine deaminase 1